MTMKTRALTKAAIAGLPAGALLAFGNADPVRLLAVAAGAALVVFAWGRRARRAALAARASAPVAPRDNSDRWLPPPAPRRIDRTPTGRPQRDVHCSASRPATARARRSSRRH